MADPMQVAQTWEEWQADKTMSLGSCFTKRFARFVPCRTDELRPEWTPFIGKTATWHCAGDADPDRYPGQTSWCSEDRGWPWHWVPEQDLVEVVRG